MRRPGADGKRAADRLLETTLAQMIDEGLVLDAVIAPTEVQRRAMWARREAAAEIMQGLVHSIDTDVAVPLTAVGAFLDRAVGRAAPRSTPARQTLTVAHLGDGNLHYLGLSRPATTRR